MVAKAYAALGTQSKTAALLGISQQAVSDILTRCPDTLAVAKNKVAGMLVNSAVDTLERAHNGAFGDFKSRESAMISGVCAPLDKAAQLTAAPMQAMQVNINLGELSRCVEVTSGSFVTPEPS